MKQVVRPLLAVLCLVACGCAVQRLKMYDGGDLPAARTALISGLFDRNGQMVSLEKVDGITVTGQGPLRGSIFGRKTEAMVKPGAHSVEVSWRTAQAASDGNVRLTFSVLAGRSYEIRVGHHPQHAEEIFWRSVAQETPGRAGWLVWVVDTASGLRLPLLADPPSARPES